MNVVVDQPYLTWARAHIGRQPLCLRGSGIPGRPVTALLQAALPAQAGDTPEASHERAFTAALACRLGANPEQIFPALGTSGANAALLPLLLRDGGELLCERPFYDPLWRCATSLGAPVRFFDRRPEDGWRLDPIAVEAALTHQTRAVILARPHNPTGADISERDLLALAEMAADHDLTVIVDEVYLDFVPGARPAFLLHPRLCSTASLTKVYGLGEHRLGWVAADPTLIARLFERRLHGEALLPSLPFRVALGSWERLDGWLAEARAQAERGSALLREALAGIDGLLFCESRTPFGFAWWGGDDLEAVRALEERGVGATPGGLFGAPGGLRIGWTRDLGAVERAGPVLREVLSARAAR